ncbi:hypothetical protein FN846DRAFT_969521 [Sphaerosporella brunnea]|uniref:CUE domain-containing protein n=1 Tax=Sphaerosporella brunnea TaxID=1250544 RepID=A0A5J5EIH9_9PEZI|nr:hypothetical protein FN846DRAFT_969521 [Sphaerosporella brunnea]
MSSEKPSSEAGAPSASVPEVTTTSAENASTPQGPASSSPKVPEETAPAKPPRPVSPNSQNQATLEEAFPGIDKAVIRAVLVASRGDLEPAFNALLSMSDPSAVETPPPPPPRPRAQPKPSTDISIDYITSTPQSQLDADALYARQLQEHFGAAVPRPHRSAAQQGRQQPGRRHPNDDSDDEYYHDDSDKERPSFFEEDLPVIKENIRKGFLETQEKVTGWFNEFKKKIDGESPNTSPPSSARTSGQYSRAGSRRTQTGFGGYESRRSRDVGYDADPKVLSDDFTHLSLKDDTVSESAPRRPKANPNLFQPSTTTGGTRRVSFEDRPSIIENDDDLYRRPSSASARRSSASPARQASPAGNSKWEPLKSIEPEPLHKDPFSLEDSDDEKDGLIKEGEMATTKNASVTGPQESGVTKTS